MSIVQTLKFLELYNVTGLNLQTNYAALSFFQDILFYDPLGGGGGGGGEGAGFRR